MGVKELIAIRICSLRKKKKISREQLALKSGLELMVIAQAESGGNHISIETLNKILNALEISLRDFIGKKVLEKWINERPWKEYFYINMNKSVYLYGDQPTTCEFCGSRTDIVFEYDALYRYASVNQCLDKKCRYIFMEESDWDEMRRVIAVIRGRWKNISTFEDCI